MFNMPALKRHLLTFGIGLVIGLCGALFYYLSSSGNGETASTARRVPGDHRTTTSVESGDLLNELKERHKTYSRTHARKDGVLLREVIAVYMRTNAEECLSVLQDLGLTSMVSLAGLSDLSSIADTGDLESVLKVASKLDARIVDPMVTEAFQKKIASDPAKAFEYISFLPSFLRGKLATELAEKWGEKDGPAAAKAFFKYQRGGAWTNQFSVALAGWGKHDPEGAFRYLVSIDDASANVHSLIDSFIVQLARTNVDGAARIIAERVKEVNGNGISLDSVFREFAKQNSRQAFEAALRLPSETAQWQALMEIGGYSAIRNPEFALEVAARVPTSEYSLAMAKKAALWLAYQRPADPYSVAERQPDPIQRSAAIGGVTEGLFKRKGIAGVSEAIRHGITSKAPEWLESAGSFILETNPPAGTNGKASVEWRTIPRDLSAAILRHAEANWPADRVALLKSRIQ